MSHAYTDPSLLTLAAYRYLYDPLRGGQLRSLVGELGLTGSERVLDFGSGAGSEARYLAEALCRGGRVTCLDVSRAWLREARRRLRRYDNVEFVLGDAREAGLPSGSFDLIFAHFSLHDVDREALPATIASLARSLAPSGRFVIVEPAETGNIHHALVPDELARYMAAVGLRETSRERVPSAPGMANRAVFELATRAQE